MVVVVVGGGGGGWWWQWWFFTAVCICFECRCQNLLFLHCFVASFQPGCARPDLLDQVQRSQKLSCLDALRFGHRQGIRVIYVQRLQKRNR